MKTILFTLSNCSPALNKLYAIQQIMVNSCCAPGCTNRQSKEKGISLHRFPKRPLLRREVWIRAVDRSPVDLDPGSGKVSQKPWAPTEGSRICGIHFTEGKPSDVPSHRDFTPSLNLRGLQPPKRKRKETCQHCKKPKEESSGSKKQKSETRSVKEKKKETKQKSETISVKEQKSETISVKEQKSETISVKEQKSETISVKEQKAEMSSMKEQQTEPSGAMDDAANALLELSEQSHNNKCSTGSQTEPLPESETRRAMTSYHHMDNKGLNLYTGLPRPKFLWLFDQLRPYISEKQISRDITLYDHLLLVLAKMRLRSGDLHLAYEFSISETDVSQIWSTWLPILSRRLRDLIIWPEQEIARSTIPSVFKPEYRNCVSIIENFEVEYQPCLSDDVFYSDEAWLARPRAVTKKYLISITPFGAISFISKGFNEGISEKEMTLASGYIDKLRPGDEVIADNRFTLAEEMRAKGASLTTAYFAIGEYQQAEVDASERVRCLRNEVVDTVCGKLLKKFSILESDVVGDVERLDDVVALACALYNLKPCAIKFKPAY